MELENHPFFWGVSVILSHTRSIGVASHHGVATTLDGTLESTWGYPKNMRTKYDEPQNMGTICTPVLFCDAALAR